MDLGGENAGALVEEQSRWMETEPDKSAEDLAKIRQEIVALRRRLKVSARKNRKLSSDTEMLLKKVALGEADLPVDDHNAGGDGPERRL